MHPHTGGPTRRQMVKTGLGGAAGLVLGLGLPFGRLIEAAQAPQGTTNSIADVQRLADDLFVLRTSSGSNVVAQTSPDGVLLVDGGAAEESAALLRAISALPGGGPVHTLFNTHWHPEQTGSNLPVGEAGGTIVAHENTRLWLTTDVTWPWNGRRFEPLPRVAQPNRTFYVDGELDSGVRYGYLPDAAHTDGDLYVQFPDRQVLAVGGVVAGHGWPMVDWPTGGWIGGIVGGLDRVQALATPETRIVPAQGPVLGLTEIETLREMYGTIYDRLSMLLYSGRGPDEAVAARPTAEFDAQMGSPDEFVRRAFESLWAYLSPDA